MTDQTPKPERNPRMEQARRSADRDLMCDYCGYSLYRPGHSACRREAEREDHDPRDDR